MKLARWRRFVSSAWFFLFILIFAQGCVSFSLNLSCHEKREQRHNCFCVSLLYCASIAYRSRFFFAGATLGVTGARTAFTTSNLPLFWNQETNIYILKHQLQQSRSRSRSSIHFTTKGNNTLACWFQQGIIQIGCFGTFLPPCKTFLFHRSGHSPHH